MNDIDRKIHALEERIRKWESSLFWTKASIWIIAINILLISLGSYR